MAPRSVKNGISASTLENILRKFFESFYVSIILFSVSGLKLGTHLGDILDYELGSNSRHHLDRKWAWQVAYAPFPHLEITFNVFWL